MRLTILAGSAGLLMLALAAGAARAGDSASSNWTGSISAGADLTRGNSETMLYSGSFSVEKRTQVHEFKFTVEANYGESETTKSNGVKTTQANVNNAKAVAEYKWLFLRRTYLYLNTEINRDDIADIEYRLLVGPGLGYYLLKTDAHKLNSEAGVSYLHEKKSAADEDTLMARFAERYELAISKTSKLWEAAEYLVSFEGCEDYRFNCEVGIESVITEEWSLKLTLQDKYTSRPAAGKKQNDLTLKASISYKW